MKRWGTRAGLAGMLVVAALVLMPGASTQAGGGITVTMTVAVDPTPDDENDQVCEPTKDKIKVKKKTPLDICYEISNSSGATLTRHDLTDSQAGIILDDFPFNLVTGASAYIINSADDLKRSATFKGHWVAANSSFIHQASDKVKIKIKKKN